MCQPGSSRNNRPTHRGWPGGEVACSEINSSLRCGCAGNCAFESPAKASIAHAVRNTILRRRKRTIVTWTRPRLLVAGSRPLGGKGSEHLLTRPTPRFDQHVHFIWSCIPEIQADAAVWQLGNLRRN